MEQIGQYTPSLKKMQVDEKSTESTELAREIYNHFGKESGRKVYPLFSNPRYTHRQIKDAWKAFKNTGQTDWKYFCGILNRTK